MTPYHLVLANSLFSVLMQPEFVFFLAGSAGLAATFKMAKQNKDSRDEMFLPFAEYTLRITRQELSGVTRTAEDALEIAFDRGISGTAVYDSERVLAAAACISEASRGTAVKSVILRYDNARITLGRDELLTRLEAVCRNYCDFTAGGAPLPPSKHECGRCRYRPVCEKAEN